MRIFSIALALTCAAARAEDPADAAPDPVAAVFEARTFEEDGFRLPYRLSKPASAGPDNRRPLLLFLHGFGERGDDNLRQLVNGGAWFASAEFRERFGAYVVAPQCPATDLPGGGGPTIWSSWLRPTNVSPPHAPDSPPSVPLRAVMRLIDKLLAEEPIDPARLYVSGLSMGGYATWELAARQPDRWAAAAPICGGGNPAWGEALAAVPVWAVHGDADQAVPVERSREMVAAILTAGGRPIYTEHPGVDHDSWTPTFGSRYVWDWMFAQRK